MQPAVLLLLWATNLVTALWAGLRRILHPVVAHYLVPASPSIPRLLHACQGLRSSAHAVVLVEFAQTQLVADVAIPARKPCLPLEASILAAVTVPVAYTFPCSAADPDCDGDATIINNFLGNLEAEAPAADEGPTPSEDQAVDDQPAPDGFVAAAPTDASAYATLPAVLDATSADNPAAVINVVHPAEEEVAVNIAPAHAVALPNDAAADGKNTIILVFCGNLAAEGHAVVNCNQARLLAGAANPGAPLHTPCQPLAHGASLQAPPQPVSFGAAHPADETSNNADDAEGVITAATPSTSAFLGPGLADANSANEAACPFPCRLAANTDDDDGDATIMEDFLRNLEADDPAVDEDLAARLAIDDDLTAISATKGLGAAAPADDNAAAMILVAVVDAAPAEDSVVAKLANTPEEENVAAQGCPAASVRSKHSTLAADSLVQHHHAYDATKKASILDTVCYLVSSKYPDICFAANQHLDSSKRLFLNLQRSYTLSTLDSLGACTAVPLPPERLLHFLLPLARCISGAHWFNTHGLQQFSHPSPLVSKYPFVPVALTLFYVPFDIGGAIPPGQHAEAHFMPLLRVQSHPLHQLLIPSNTHISLPELLTILLDNLHQAVCLTTLALFISIYLCQSQIFLSYHGEQCSKLQMVEGLENVEVKDIAGSGVVSMAIDAHGSLWAWGKSKRGQLGLGEMIIEAPLPQRVQALSGHQIVQELE
ncbi:hypothetical protein L7F22_036802 [Adiantum nelumboides]|nr:hypothetical protein [Adiantum nelumboides]